MTLIRGKHTIQFGAQVEVGYDNYFQTNIGTGGFAFNGVWTELNPTLRLPPPTPIPASALPTSFSAWPTTKDTSLTRRKVLPKFRRKLQESRITGRSTVRILGALRRN